MDIDYELDLLEFEGICERERALPVTKMRYCALHRMQMVDHGTSMEFELSYHVPRTQGSSSNPLVYGVLLWFCCFYEFAFWYEIPTNDEWIDTATGHF